MQNYKNFIRLTKNKRANAFLKLVWWAVAAKVLKGIRQSSDAHVCSVFTSGSCGYARTVGRLYPTCSLSRDPEILDFEAICMLFPWSFCYMTLAKYTFCNLHFSYPFLDLWMFSLVRQLLSFQYSLQYNLNIISQ